MSLRKNKNERQATGFRRFPKNQKTTKRVVDIILDENHPNYRGPQDIGIIFFADEDLQEFSFNSEVFPIAKPLNKNQFTYPLIGELVNIDGLKSSNYYASLGGNPNYTENYYTPAINIHNNAGSNALPLQSRKKNNKTRQSEPSDFNFQSEFKSPSREVAAEKLEVYLRSLGYTSGRSDPRAPNYNLFQKSNGDYVFRLEDSDDNEIKLGTYFKENINLNPLKPSEGDSIMEGKNGQRIRFTTTGPNGTNAVSRNVTDDPEDGNATVGDKAMILSLGNANQENITADAASVYMLENQSIPIDVSSTNIDSLKSEYTPIEDPLEKIQNIEPVPIPRQIPENELIIQEVEEFTTGSTNETIEEPSQQILYVEEELGYYDPVFAALDDAQDAGLVTVNNFDNPLTSGTPSSQEVNQTEGEAPVEGIVTQNGNEEEFPPNLSFDDYEELYKNKPNAPYAQRNREKINQWVDGEMNIFMETCAGKQFPLPQPDPNLTVVKQTQRDIKHIIIHCTGGSKTSNPARTLSFFFNPDDPQKEGLQGRLFERPGYHWLIEQNGDATHTCPDELRSQGILADAGVTNTNSIQITWIGGYKGKFDISDAQASTIKTLIDKYLEIYEDAKLLGHNQISDKECPNIWVPSFAATLGYKSKNIGNTIFGNINFFYDENNQTKERDDVVLLDEYQQRAEELANKLI